GLGVADHLAAGDHATGNDVVLADGEDLANLGGTGFNLLGFRSQLSQDPFFHILGNVIDDIVFADIYALLLDQALGIGVLFAVEADNQSVGRRGQHDIRL